MSESLTMGPRNGSISFSWVRRWSPGEGCAGNAVRLQICSQHWRRQHHPSEASLLGRDLLEALSRTELPAMVLEGQATQGTFHGKFKKPAVFYGFVVGYLVTLWYSWTVNKVNFESGTEPATSFLELAIETPGTRIVKMNRKEKGGIGIHGFSSSWDMWREEALFGSPVRKERPAGGFSSAPLIYKVLTPISVSWVFAGNRTIYQTQHGFSYFF